MLCFGLRQRTVLVPDYDVRVHFDFGFENQKLKKEYHPMENSGNKVHVYLLDVG